MSRYLDNTLESAELDSFEKHLSDCARCIPLVGQLVRGRRRTPTKRQQVPIRMRFEWAAAAAVVLAVGLFAVINLPVDEASRETRSERYADVESEVPTLSAPVQGTAVLRDELVFSWTEVPDSVYYDLHILADDGDVIWQERVTQSRWVPDESVRLEHGSMYFVRIDAHLSDTRLVSSEHVSFSVREVE